MSRPHAADAEWDDDRLTAAFRARSSEASPQPWLVTSTVERVRTQRGADIDRWHRLRLVVAPVAVLIVSVLIAGSFIGLQPRRTPPSTISPSTLGATPQASHDGRPSPTDSPNQVFGLNIIDVADAIAIRDGGRDDREIAVRGWYSPVPPVEAFSCPIILELVAPVQFGCRDSLLAITQDPQVRARRDGSGVDPPVGPAISPSFDQIDPRPLAEVMESINPRSCGTRTECPSPRGSILIVAIGHFDDRRAELCKATVRTQCRDRFVVDRLDSVDGRLVPTSAFDQVQGNHFWLADDVETLEGRDPAERVLSMSVVSGTQNKSLSIEPTLVTRSSWNAAGAVWLVRRLVGGTLVTHAIVDGTDRVFVIQDDGTLDFVKGSVPTSQSTPWPPMDAIVVKHIGSRPDRQLVVAVVDLSGHLVSAGLAKPVPGPQGRQSVRRLVRVERLDDTSIVAGWVGGLCDDHLTLRVRGDATGVPDGLFLDGKWGGPCRLELVVWDIELQFDQPVDPGKFATQYGIDGEGGP